jgi:hypothetical protein
MEDLIYPNLTEGLREEEQEQGRGEDDDLEDRERNYKTDAI